MSDKKKQAAPAPAQDQPNLPPWETDLEERLNSCAKELAPLLAKYELGLVAKPKIMPDGTLGGDVVVGSTRKAPANPATSTATSAVTNPDA